MHSYEEFEKIIFEWLMDKHKADSSFAFSLRQKAGKGAELDYFIGTKQSKYFSTTFWYIPVNYPGSTSDLINLLFVTSENGYKYRIQFTQTKSPGSIRQYRFPCKNC
ncbi:MAG: hypothetical protein HXX09_13715 [Bacteroidetes bacterium]|nr:hypothetical protein [Bacteroidota bacterium]